MDWNKYRKIHSYEETYCTFEEIVLLIKHFALSLLLALWLLMNVRFYVHWNHLWNTCLTSSTNNDETMQSTILKKGLRDMTSSQIFKKILTVAVLVFFLLLRSFCSMLDQILPLLMVCGVSPPPYKWWK